MNTEDLLKADEFLRMNLSHGMYHGDGVLVGLTPKGKGVIASWQTGYDAPARAETDSYKITENDGDFVILSQHTRRFAKPAEKPVMVTGPTGCTACNFQDIASYHERKWHAGDIQMLKTLRYQKAREETKIIAMMDPRLGEKDGYGPHCLLGKLLPASVNPENVIEMYSHPPHKGFGFGFTQNQSTAGGVSQPFDQQPFTLALQDNDAESICDDLWELLTIGSRLSLAVIVLDPKNCEQPWTAAVRNRKK